MSYVRSLLPPDTQVCLQFHYTFPDAGHCTVRLWIITYCQLSEKRKKSRGFRSCCTLIVCLSTAGCYQTSFSSSTLDIHTFMPILNAYCLSRVSWVHMKLLHVSPYNFLHMTSREEECCCMHKTNTSNVMCRDGDTWIYFTCIFIQKLFSSEDFK